MLIKGAIGAPWFNGEPVVCWENNHAQICLDWYDRHYRRGPFGRPDFGQVVGRKELVCISGQGHGTSR
jgi:hypothetical protein